VLSWRHLGFSCLQNLVQLCLLTITVLNSFTLYCHTC
jgi:hypothetical protein